MPKGKESVEHQTAINKLFDLIKNKKVKIHDTNGNEYSIFENVYKDEFLHIESPTMLSDRKVLYSNVNSPCKKFFEKNKKLKPHCNMEGCYGAIKELPCKKCLKDNFNPKIFTSGNKLISFRPDIAFGYEGEYKVWLEIKKSSPCSYRKKQFCYEKNIVLLEINADKIIEYEEGEKLIFKKLIFKDKNKSTDELLNEVIAKINSKVKKNGYIFHKDIKNFYYTKLKYKYENIDDQYELFLKGSGLVEYSVNSKPIRQFLAVSNKTIYVNKSTVDGLLYIEKHYDYHIDDLIRGIFSTICKEVLEKEIMLLNEFKDKLVRLSPNGHKSVFNGSIEDKLNKHGLFQIHNDKDFSLKLMTIGIDVGRKHLVVNERMHEEMLKLGYSK